MLVQSPISIAAKHTAYHLRRYRRFAARNAPGMPTPQETEILACADRMEASKTLAQYEAALRDAHRLGMFPYNSGVRQVAQAGVLFAD
jgi:hypothetical protein